MKVMTSTRCLQYRMGVWLIRLVWPMNNGCWKIASHLWKKRSAFQLFNMQNVFLGFHCPAQKETFVSINRLGDDLVSQCAGWDCADDYLWELFQSQTSGPWCRYECPCMFFNVTHSHIAGRMLWYSGRHSCWQWWRSGAWGRLIEQKDFSKVPGMKGWFSERPVSFSKNKPYLVPRKKNGSQTLSFQILTLKILRGGCLRGRPSESNFIRTVVWIVLSCLLDVLKSLMMLFCCALLVYIRLR